MTSLSLQKFKIKGTSHDIISQISIFPHLLKFLHIKTLLLHVCTNLYTKVLSPAEPTYL